MDRQRIVMVGGGKGGVGKSSVAAGLARSLAREDLQVGVIDTDLSGPSQAKLFPAKPMTVRNGDMQPAEAGGLIRVVSTGYVARPDSALVWSDATSMGAVSELTSAKLWAHTDVIIVDLPPGQGVVTTEVVKRFPHAHAILVTTGSPLALEECERAARFFLTMEIQVLGLVVNMSHMTCEQCGESNALYPPRNLTATVERLQLDVVGRIPYGVDVAAGVGLSGLAAMVRNRSGKEKSLDYG